MILSASFPIGALETLLNITPIEEFLLAEAVRGSYRITVIVGSGMSAELVPMGKRKAMMMFAMRQEDSANVSRPNKENKGIREKFRMS